MFDFVLVSIFKGTEDPSLYENHEHVLLLMEKYLFIASPLDPLGVKQEPANQLNDAEQHDLTLVGACKAIDVADDEREDGAAKEVSMLKIRN